MNTLQRETIFLPRQRFLQRLQDVELFRRTLAEINAIREGGETAILEVYQQKGIRRSVVTVSAEEVQQGMALLPGRDVDALAELKRRCQRLARLQKDAFRSHLVLDDSDTVYSALQFRPLDAAGIYIPDRMPSTLILYCSLAQEAGVEHIMLALPPRADGTITPSLLAAASFFPVSIIAVGGKSAFPALAFGLCGHLPNKLFGPCSFFVNNVKEVLSTFYKVPIDLPAGPTELVVYVEGERDVQQACHDIRAQMEHGEDACCFLLATQASIIAKLRSLLPELSAQVAFLLAADHAEVAEIINSIAPEILELFMPDPDPLVRRVKHAANVYVNVASPLGDYCAFGSGCCDPTFGTASGLTGVTIESFFKASCISTGLKRPASPEPWLTRLAELEQFPNHLRAIQAYVSQPGG